ncbi:MAG: YIP1 family protein [Actinobacteria bacterium]|nr:YIP1 family protein [Actinomycetota bacterium]
MHDYENEGFGHGDSPEAVGESKGFDKQSESQRDRAIGRMGFTEPVAGVNAPQHTVGQGKSTTAAAADLLYGVIAKPVDSLRHIADNKLVLAGILIFVAVVWLNAISALPSMLNELNQAPEIRRLPLFKTSRSAAIFTVIITFLITFVSFFIRSGLYHGIALLLKGKGNFTGLLGALGFANFPFILTVPFGLLGFVDGWAGRKLPMLASFPFAIWVIVLEIIAIRENYKFSTGRAVVTFFIPPLVLLALILIPIIGIFILIFTFSG